MTVSKFTRKVVADNGTEIVLQSPQELAAVRAGISIEAGSKVRVLADKPEHSRLKLGSIEEVVGTPSGETIKIKDGDRSPWFISPKHLEPVTPAEAAGYAVGDIFKLVVDEPNGLSWAAGTKVVLVTDDGSRMPRFAKLSDGIEGWVILGGVVKLGQVAVEQEAEPKEEPALATIQFDPEPEQSIRAGVPFTWGVRNTWWVKSESGVLTRLSDGQEYTGTESSILSNNIKYATTMELR